MQTFMLWALALCGGAIAWSAMTAANFMSGSERAAWDRAGWCMTGMVGLWAALQPFVEFPPDIPIHVLIMAASLAAQSWRLSKLYRR